jgi:hypothetical protein
LRSEKRSGVSTKEGASAAPVGNSSGAEYIHYLGLGEKEKGEGLEGGREPMLMEDWTTSS